MFLFKLKSGALQLTIFIGVIIALLLSGLILYAYTFGFFKEQTKHTINIIKGANSGLYFALQAKNFDEDTLVFDIDEEKKYSAKIHSSLWGVFQKVSIKTIHKNKFYIKSAIVGSKLSAENSPTLYLQETYNAFNVAGNTKIKGNAFLPEQGVKSSYVLGEGYNSNVLVYGQTKRSKTTLPKLDKAYLKRIEEYLKHDNTSLPFSQLGLRNVNSFKNQTQIFYSEQPIDIDKMEIVGNIIIKSNVSIKISKENKITDIIVIAPNVQIEDGFTGSLQIISSKNINIGKDCTLKFPSSVFVLDEENIKFQAVSTKPKISIGQNSSVRGCLVYYNKINNHSQFNSNVFIDENSKIKGQVYCTGNLELKGNVAGSVYTKQFVLNAGGTVFVNYLYNIIIENENIPKNYGGILFEDDAKILMKWLY